MKKYIVAYQLLSGAWGHFSTDDRDEADAYAESEEKRTGLEHRVYRRNA